MRDTVARWLRDRTAVPKEPLWGMPLTAALALFAGSLTLLLEQGDFERARNTAGLTGPAPETTAVVIFILLAWLVELAGFRWPRLFFVVLVILPTVWLMFLGRVIYAPYFLIMVAARIPWVGTRGEMLVTLVLALVASYLPVLRLGDKYNHWIVIYYAISSTCFMSYLFDVARRSNLQLEAAQAELARQAVAAERRQIAREVHDVIAHSMAIMMLHLTGARHILQRDPERAAEALAQAEQFGRLSLGDLRRTVTLLRDDGGQTGVTPPLPGAAQIGDLVERYRKAGLKVDLQVADAAATRSVSPAVGLDLYRITQEALTNVVKHAPGAEVRIRLEVESDHTKLTVSDTGKRGATLSSSAPSGPAGLGIASMQERAVRLGGQLDAGPCGTGWQVECVIPSNRCDATSAH